MPAGAVLPPSTIPRLAWVSFIIVSRNWVAPLATWELAMSIL